MSVSLFYFKGTDYRYYNKKDLHEFNDYKHGVDKVVENLRFRESVITTSLINFKKPSTMNNRDEYLVALRPEIPNARVSDDMSVEEQFQNRTLRPIAKLQHDLLIAVFHNYIKKHKNVFWSNL
ncbi:hypothetical protein JCM19297_3629 [Nonlabens ulvanivorans]|nr:hypothetical protein JCM19297_3629 [Nonlabens ulvanivorans]